MTASEFHCACRLAGGHAPRPAGGAEPLRAARQFPGRVHGAADPGPSLPAAVVAGAAVVTEVMEEHPGSYVLDDACVEHARPTRSPTELTVPAIPPDRVVVIGYTSGSTGRPKPNPKTWGGFAACTALNASRLRDMLHPKRDGLLPWIVATVPSQHMYGMELSVLMPLLAGMGIHGGHPLYPADIASALAELPEPAHPRERRPVHLRALLQSGVELPALGAVVSATAPLPAGAGRGDRTAIRHRRCSSSSARRRRASSRHVARRVDDVWHPYPGVTLTPADDGTQVDAPVVRLPRRVAGCPRDPPRRHIHGARPQRRHGRGGRQASVARGPDATPGVDARRVRMPWFFSLTLPRHGGTAARRAGRGGWNDVRRQSSRSSPRPSIRRSCRARWCWYPACRATKSASCRGRSCSRPSGAERFAVALHDLDFEQQFGPADVGSQDQERHFMAKALAKPALDGSGVGSIAQVNLHEAVRIEPRRVETCTRMSLPRVDPRDWQGLPRVAPPYRRVHRGCPPTWGARSAASGAESAWHAERVRRGRTGADSSYRADLVGSFSAHCRDRVRPTDTARASSLPDGACGWVAYVGRCGMRGSERTGRARDRSSRRSRRPCPRRCP